jgi:plasmid stabilization system protein ParE
MNVVIREAAYHDLDRLYSWIVQDRPRAAQRVIARLLHGAQNR